MTYSSLVWNIKEGGSLRSPGGTNHHVCLTQIPVPERGGFPRSLCHVTKKDSWRGKVPQTIVSFSYTCSCRIHTDAMIKTHAGRLLYKYIPLTLLQGYEKGIQGLRVRGSWRPNRNCNILTPKLMAVNAMSFLFSWCWGPLCWVLAFLTASYQHLLWTPTHQGPKPLWPGVAFPTTSPLQLAATQLALDLRLDCVV